MGKYFGTDGFRGKANEGLTASHAYEIGRFLGWYYSRHGRAQIVVGKDTRRSCYMLEYAISAGMAASGADVHLLHVTTTPSVSYVTRTDGFDCGVMISASHNPYYDNGIKLMNREGEKMEEATIRLVEDYLDGKLEVDGVRWGDLPLATGEAIGKIVDYTAGRNRYMGYLISQGIYSFKGKKVALDCANGAAWNIAPMVFKALGADVHVINAEPDGLNINLNAGSTHMEGLKRYVKDNGMDVGFAFDGDADRCLAVDENGELVDGDKIMYILARRLHARDMLADNTVVATVMSNSGFVAALEKAGLSCVQTTVGDRFVYDCMQQHGYSLGGEQSGHIILKKYATTGDGLLTAIMLTEEMCDEKQPLSKLAAPVTLYPQYTENVRVRDKEAVLADERVLAEKDAVASLIGRGGRVLLRQSGTEPVVRVMVESESEEMCHACVNEVIAVMKNQGLTEEE